MTDTVTPPESPAPGRALIAACLIVVGSAAVGLAAGLVWAAAAPRVVYQVYTLNPPTAYAINPETSAFIAADGWYCLLALIGGALIGLLGYLFAVRRYGPVPMAAIVIGATGAAFLMQWLGPQESGQPGFNHLLATSRTGTLLHAPISLGSHGALAFWPLAAAAVAGGIELVGVLRARRQPAYTAVPVPGMGPVGPLPAPDGPPGWPSPPGPQPAPDGPPGWPSPPGPPAAPDQAGAEPSSEPDTFGGDPGRAAL
jgi:hypothetical protein